MREIARRLIMYICVCVIVLSDVVGANASTVLDSNETEKYLNTIAKNLMSTYSNPTYGSNGGEWTIIGLARDGSLDKAYIDVYKKNLSAAIKKSDGVLSENKYTEYSRVVLAITAIGENAADFDGYNLVEKICDVESVNKQGINGIAYALIALDSGKYGNDDGGAGEMAREKFVSEILQAQLADGGWSIAGTSGDADMTAVCIQALTPYVNSNEEVKEAVDLGINLLSKLQCNSGGFATMGLETCESVAQVLVAISGMGISVEDERFVKGGNTLIDALLDYYKNGGFSHLAGKSKNAIATDQGMYALVSYYRNINNKNRLYDMSDGLVYRTLGDTITETSKQEQNTDNNHKETTVTASNNKSETDNKKSQNNTEIKPDKSSDGSSQNESNINNQKKEHTTKKSKKKSNKENKNENKKDKIKDNDKVAAGVEEVATDRVDETTNKKSKTEESTSEAVEAENDTTKESTVEEIESVVANDKVTNVSKEETSGETISDVTSSENNDANKVVEYDKSSDYVKIVVCIIVIAVALGFDKVLFFVKRKQGKDNHV